MGTGQSGCAFCCPEARVSGVRGGSLTVAVLASELGYVSLLGSTTAMPDHMEPNLFSAAGVLLDAVPVPAKPKRASKPKVSTPAQRAAADRLTGGRRLRAPQAAGQRTRVGQPRDLSPAPVLAFPLARNARVVAEVIERLPHGYARDLDKKSAQETRRLQKRLMQSGISKQSAWLCARELVHVAYIERVRDAHKEAGIL